MCDKEIVLNKAFFDDLWPLILDNGKVNLCQISGDAGFPFYEPERKFDERWACGVLAKGKYKNYVMPIMYKATDFLRVTFGYRESELNVAEIVEKTYEQRKTKIPTITEQIAAHDQQEYDLGVMCDNFVMRKVPWYYSPYKDEIRPTLTQEQVKDWPKFELDVLRKIYKYNISTIIIDMHLHFDARTLEGFWKLLNFVKIVAVTRDKTLERQLYVLQNMYPLLVEDNDENNWHEKLQEALDKGVEHARKHKLLGYCGQAFIYMFSSKRWITKCDTFKVLEKENI